MNFVSPQCFLNIQMSCRFPVLLICHFQDRYSNLLVPLYLMGSNSYEIFFSKIGGMMGLQRLRGLHELINTTNTLNHLSTIEYNENGMKFGQTINKIKNYCAKLHKL